MKKIVIFSDLYNGKFYRESAKKCGWEPYIFLTVKCEDESIYCVNQFEDVEKLASDVETLIGGKPDAVLCCVEQISLPVAKYAEYIGVPINSVDTYRKLRDKKLMKQIWQSNGVDTAKYYYCQKTKDIPWEKINYPVIVKPTMGAASIGVYLCRNEEMGCKGTKISPIVQIFLPYFAFSLQKCGRLAPKTSRVITSHVTISYLRK